MTAMNPVLARKMGLEAPPAAAVADPASPLRLMRRAVSRAADQALSLSATVHDIVEDRCEVEEMIEDGPDGWVVLGLRDGSNAGLTGLMLIDPVVRQALVDMQTMGRLMPVMAEQRRVTRTDAALMLPLAEDMLRQLAEVGFGAGRVDMVDLDVAPIDDLRTAGLVMVQGSYLRWRVAVHIGSEAVAGDIILALRLPKIEGDGTGEGQDGWHRALRASVCEAEADLDAVLCRMRMPMDRIEAFEVGQVLPMAGTTVGSVTLTGPDGSAVAVARLGQMAGKRAVRLQQPTLTMDDDMGIRPPVPPTVPTQAALPDSGARVIPDTGKDEPETGAQAPDPTGSDRTLP
ncbi:FliM/FliN family flagellar motor C-terminal domain-containing protein [Pseudooctadecabacter sp.]|uniref:FliM/FliN family flagellar motor C-terminal domain-containing protein n=1 Tax=Pseudooctadecabacter sp. TaxID=1966338 RepID=UPI0025FAD5A0|nr:FliM/FliN family flagellar motor C-terminal domain-containing protein [Pseudooctadecabacter sp.]